MTTKCFTTLKRVLIYLWLSMVDILLQGNNSQCLFLKEFVNSDFKKQVIDMAGVCDIPISANLPALCLMSLENTLKPYVYYYDDIGCYTFVHESVLEIMMSTFVERHPQHVLESINICLISVV
jgi:hypothetical protein